MKNNYLLVHGSFCNPFSNWIPYLRKKIENKSLEVYTPDFPTGVGYQNYENWSRLLKTYVEANIINENTFIFAHSIAPIFICKFLVENEINKSMYFDNLLDVKKYCDDIVCFYSDNDPYVKYETEKEFADTITNNQIMISGGGHLNSESGYTEFEELLKYI